VISSAVCRLSRSYSYGLVLNVYLCTTLPLTFDFLLIGQLFWSYSAVGGIPKRKLVGIFIAGVRCHCCGLPAMSKHHRDYCIILLPCELNSVSWIAFFSFWYFCQHSSF